MVEFWAREEERLDNSIEDKFYHRRMFVSLFSFCVFRAGHVDICVSRANHIFRAQHAHFAQMLCILYRAFEFGSLCFCITAQSQNKNDAAHAEKMASLQLKSALKVAPFAPSFVTACSA